MKNEAKFIYYGIVFLFLYTTILRICERLITTIVVCFSWNVYIVHASLIIVAAGMLYAFLRRKSFIPVIKPWTVIAIIISYILAICIAPEYWLREGDYSPSETAALLSSKPIITGVFRWAIVIISYIKYYRLNKKQCN